MGLFAGVALSRLGCGLRSSQAWGPNWATVCFLLNFIFLLLFTYLL